MGFSRGGGKIAEIIQDFTNQLEKLRPNPLKIKVESRI